MSDILGERDDHIPDRPTRVAEPSRRSQLPKRFYQSVGIKAQDQSFLVTLDGKPIKTPSGTRLSLPVKPLADMISAEWETQKEYIDPVAMPVTRLVNTAIDGVSTEMQAVKEDMIRYAGSDLLCYRASSPQTLIELQAHSWDPILDWALSTLGARMDLIEGIIHQPQPQDSIAALNAHIGMIDSPLVLAGAHVVTSLTSSCLIAMAVLRGHLTLQQAWDAAHVDEDWNIAQWGEDAEARQFRENRFQDMTAAVSVIRALV